jgi:hypothetical protein
MSMIVPDTVEVEIITGIITPALTLRLYSNNYTPVPTSIAANFTEIVGGGYAAKALTFASWVITPNSPSDALYPLQTWTFTGPTNAPGTIYGYYVTRNSDGLLRWAGRFAVGYLPFSPIAGSTVKITPRFTASSLY